MYFLSFSEEVQSSKSSKLLQQFDFLFLIPLRNVNDNSTLPELVKTQLDLDTDIPSDYIDTIIRGKNNIKTLIILDGYDEYTKGTNQDIDRLIASTSRNCFLLVTSRFGEYLKKSARKQMDGEVVIKGFSEENIAKCSELYLESKEISDDFLKQAKQSPIYELLHVPIVLLMSCMVFAEIGSLPRTQTELFRIAREIIMDRSTLKTFWKKCTELEDRDSWLDILGQMSWEALQRDEKQLLLDKVSANLLWIMHWL